MKINRFFFEKIDFHFLDEPGEPMLQWTDNGWMQVKG
jgi:hypothetical protein